MNLGLPVLLFEKTVSKRLYHKVAGFVVKIMSVRMGVCELKRYMVA